MTATEWIDMLRLIPETEDAKLVIVLQNGTEICVDRMFRFEPSFSIVRGRAGGTIDESRVFLVPYDQMLCLRLERTVGLEELESMFGPITPVKTTETPVVSSNHPTPIAPTDPAAASRLLLERIRAMRASAHAKMTSQVN